MTPVEMQIGSSFKRAGGFSMAMRETVGSMRAYFILTGLLGGLSNLGLLVAGRANLILLALGLLGELACVSFLYMGIRLRTLVATASPIVPRILHVTGGYLLLLLLLGLLIGGQGVGLILQSVLGLLITWYLLRNFRRLVQETRTAVIA